ncbi:uncharacterized protein [Cardiocondyla obscurior]|uniref:uncharacterized protein n=1 Tax=Cardiocondyla obscurior TaxID=286306 RepID=UPI00396561FD
MCHADSQCTRTLSTVLLGLRAHLRLDIEASPAIFLYGTSLRIPGEFLSTPDFKPDPKIFLEDFRVYMRSVKPVPITHNYKSRAFFFKDLVFCTHVFMLVKVKKSLEPPQNLKPAYFIPDSDTAQEILQSPVQTSDLQPSSSKHSVSFNEHPLPKTVPSEIQSPLHSILKQYPPAKSRS